MYVIASSHKPFSWENCAMSTASLLLASQLALMSLPVVAQNTSPEESEAINNDIDTTDNNVAPFRQARYAGNALLIHLPTNKARALIMPEPVVLQGNPEQMPGVELAYAGDVIGFFATLDFARRTVSFVGTESGTEYQLQIRASERGIVEPLEIVR